MIATASRPETQRWVKELGAHHVIDHRKPLAQEVAALGLGAPGFVFSTTNTDQHLAEIVELIAPQGRFALIDNPAAARHQSVQAQKRLDALGVHVHALDVRDADMAAQGALLNEIARLIDAGRLRTTLAERFGPINAASLRRAHALIESGRAMGKIVLEGYELDP